MTDTTEVPARIVVHADNCDSETLAAIVVALHTGRASQANLPTTPAWQLAAFHEARSDLRIVRPQQLTIRGNKQW
jgi:hypothetical protein